MITPIMFVAWLPYISLAVNIPYFIEVINRVSFDTVLQREVSVLQWKQRAGHNTFFGTVGFAVEAVEGATGTSSSAVSVAIRHGRFLGHCFFLPFAFDDHFLPAGMVFDGSESASCKKITRWPYAVERVGITSLFEISISSLSSPSSDEVLPSLDDPKNSASSSDLGVVPLVFDFLFDLHRLFFLSISEF